MVFTYVTTAPLSLVCEKGDCGITFNKTSVWPLSLDLHA